MKLERVNKEMTQNIKTMISNYSNHLTLDCNISDYSNYELQMICYYDCIQDLSKYIHIYDAVEIDTYFNSVLRYIKIHHYNL